MVSDFVNNKYLMLKSTESDINEHLPTLYEYAKGCNTICEMGVRGAVSTWAFLSGMSSTTNKKTLYCVDLVEVPEASEIVRLGKEIGVDVIFLYEDSAKLKLPVPVDLLFIDTWHIYGHLKRELAAHEKNVTKYIIMHDTTVDGIHGESLRCNLDAKQQSIDSGYPLDEITKGLQPAVDEFLEFHKGEWVVDNVWTNNNGLTVLRRKDVPHFELEPNSSASLTQYFDKSGKQL